MKNIRVCRISIYRHIRFNTVLTVIIGVGKLSSFDFDIISFGERDFEEIK